MILRIHSAKRDTAAWTGHSSALLVLAGLVLAIAGLSGSLTIVQDTIASQLSD